MNYTRAAREEAGDRLAAFSAPPARPPAVYQQHLRGERAVQETARQGVRRDPGA